MNDHPMKLMCENIREEYTDHKYHNLVFQTPFTKNGKSREISKKKN